MVRKPKVIREEKGVGASIEDTLRQIQGKFGEGAILMLGERPKVGVDAISTGSLGLDIASWQNSRDLRPGIFGQNDAFIACRGPGSKERRGMRLYRFRTRYGSGILAQIGCQH